MLSLVTMDITWEKGYLILVNNSMRVVWMKEILVIADNDVGSLAAVAETLGAVGVNIEAVSAYGIDGKAIFRFITNDVSTTLKALSKLPDLKVKEAETIIYKMIN